MSSHSYAGFTPRVNAAPRHKQPSASTTHGLGSWGACLLSLLAAAAGLPVWIAWLLPLLVFRLLPLIAWPFALPVTTLPLTALPLALPFMGLPLVLPLLLLPLPLLLLALCALLMKPSPPRRASMAPICSTAWPSSCSWAAAASCGGATAVTWPLAATRCSWACSSSSRRLCCERQSSEERWGAACTAWQVTATSLRRRAAVPPGWLRGCTAQPRANWLLAMPNEPGCGAAGRRVAVGDSAAATWCLE